MAKPGMSRLENCKSYCDADEKCLGFNVVYNKWTIPASTPWLRDAPNHGGVCIFMGADVGAQEMQTKTCHDWQGEESMCMQPFTDKDWFCCRAAFFYNKTSTAGAQTAQLSANGTATITTRHANGTTNTSQVNTGADPAPVCMAKEGDGKDRKCTFPFTYEGQEHSSCIKAGNSVPWCFTDTTNGYWGECKAGCPIQGAEAETAAATGTQAADSCKALEADGVKRACVFPFNYEGTQYSKCISAGSDKPWCFTDLQKGFWGHCEAKCPSRWKQSAWIGS